MPHPTVATMPWYHLFSDVVELVSRSEAGVMCEVPAPARFLVPFFCHLKPALCNATHVPCRVLDAPLFAQRTLRSYLDASPAGSVTCAPRFADQSSVTCTLLSGISAIEFADAVMMSGCLELVGSIGSVLAVPESLKTSVFEPAVRTRRHQLWGIDATYEPPTLYPMMESASVLRHFNVTVGTDSMYAQFAGGAYLHRGIFTQPPPRIAVSDRKLAPVLLVVSKCGSPSVAWRDAYIAEFMRHVQVDSYGRCWKNASVADVLGGDTGGGRDEKLQLLRRYKFILSIENSRCHNYVTEKFVDPLIARTVMIYLGAPNVADFAPGPRAFIDASDFKSAAALAEYVDRVDKDDALYESYFAWRAAPEGVHRASPYMQRIAERVDSIECELCRRLHCVLNGCTLVPA